MALRGRPFQPGNTYGRGRPLGSRNKVASVSQQTLEGHAEPLAKKCLFLALQGNTTAMRLCMERVMPARRQRALRFKLPNLKTMADLAAAFEAVVRGVTRGRLTTSEGEALAAMLDGRRRMIETEELEVRLRALEEGQTERSNRSRI